MRLQIIFPVCLIALSVTAQGCGPRGETNTLDQVLERSASEFETALAKAQSSGSEVLPVLEDIKQRLLPLPGVGRSLTATLEGGEQVASGANQLKEQVSQNLSALSARIDSLLPKAGATSRSGLYELSDRLKAMAQNPESVDEAKLKLLSSRVMSAIASELDGVGFKLKTE